MTSEEAIGILEAMRLQASERHASLTGLLNGCTCSRPSDLDNRLEIAAQNRDAFALAITALAGQPA